MVMMRRVKKSKYNLHNQKKKNLLEIDEEIGKDEVPEDVQIIAQEIQIVKSLACNDLTERNRQLKRLRKWLQLRTKSSFPFSQENFLRIWKGLYYNMWYSDKPLIQEELAEKLCKLLECFEGNLQYSVDFFGAFLKIMCIEWFGIDQWRIDKFLMLTRRMLRYTFKLLKSSDWSVDAIELFNKHATETILFENVSAKGLTMHYFDIFLEELAKVSEGVISAEQVGMFVKPFVKFIATQRDFNLISHCRTRIFYHLLYQSRLGREYTEKYNAWKDMGFPTKHIDDLEKIENSDVECENAGDCPASSDLDPRAGNVDVFMPELPLDAQPIMKEAENFLYKEDCPTKRRKFLKKLLDLFKTYQNGKFPLGIKTMPRFEAKSERPLIMEKIRTLDNLENELYGVDRKLKQMTKRKRRKFLKSINFDEIDESNYEQTLEKALPKDYFRSRIKRKKNFNMSGWIEEELDEDELRPKKLKKETAILNQKVFEEKKHNRKNQSKHNTENGGSVGHAKKVKVKTLFVKTKVEDISTKQNKKSKNNVESEENEIDECEKQFSNKQIIKDSKMSIGQEQKIFEITPKVLKISVSDEESKKKSINDEWNQPLCDGEQEYFLPSRRMQLKIANANIVFNPAAKQRIIGNQSTPSKNKISSLSATNTPKTPSSIKRVKIALKHNTSQNPIEYIQQIKSSPDIPYDAKRKPGKGLLKPNSIPSPINPFYKKKIGLKFLNDTV